MIRAAAIVFFAYIDLMLYLAAQRLRTKERYAYRHYGFLAITTVLYIVFAYVMVGVAPYEMFKGDGLAPVATAIEYMGPIVNGVPNPDYPWLNTAIIVSILLGYASVILVMLLGQSRVFYSMSHDGLVPKFFSELHIDYRTPYKSNLLFMLLVSCFAAFVPGRIVGEMTSIGTLFAFILVCAGVLVLRYKMEDAPRGFRTPFVPFVPILGILVCLGMMVFLPFDTWIRLIVWMIIGLDIYAGYGMKNSLLQNGTFDRRGHSIVNWSIISISILLIIVAVFHHQTAGEKDFAIFYFSMIVAFVHLAIFGYKQLRLK
ncbi:MAG: amino acid permease [Chitinophagales bacterium]|nr:amino acid permease [Chitinophagales bacterium]